MTRDVAGFIIRDDFYRKDDDEDSMVFLNISESWKGWEPALVENIGTSLLSCRLNMPMKAQVGTDGIFLRYGNRVCRENQDFSKYNVIGG